MSLKKTLPRPLILLFYFVFAMFGTGTVDCLAAQVAATLHQQAQTLNLEISVSASPPSSLIAVIKLPPQTKIAATSPESAKRDPKKSHVKWLIKNPGPGTRRFSVTTAVPTDFTKISAEVLYRKPGAEQLIKIKAQKR